MASLGGGGGLSCLPLPVRDLDDAVYLSQDCLKLCKLWLCDFEGFQYAKVFCVIECFNQETAQVEPGSVDGTAVAILFEGRHSDL